MKRNGRMSFENDDYSRYSGPDYHHHFPGLSGKDRKEGSWFNQSLYQNQKNFIGKGPKGYFRSDTRIHEEACEALARDPELDATEIEVQVRDGLITLRGIVVHRMAKKRAEARVEYISGVQDVMNEIRIKID
jgi:osmotically-inducible protein OsmY